MDKDVAVAGFVMSPSEGDLSSSSQRCFLSILDMNSFFSAQKALKYSHKGISKGVGLDSRHRKLVVTMFIANAIGTIDLLVKTM